MKNVIQLNSEIRQTLTPELIRKDKLRVYTNSGIYVIRKSEILFLKSDSNYCELYLKNGQKIFCSKTLKHFASILSKSTFFRLHNSYLVNLHLITFIDSSYKHVKVSDEFDIPIARSKVDNFKHRLNMICD